MLDDETRKLIDGLDRRLALGEVDLATYKELKEKFLSMGGNLEDTVAVLPREVEKLNCPNCGAPTDITAGAETVLCDYCGVRYRLKAAEEEMDRLRSDLRRWIRDLASGSGGVDEASRKFIFQEKIRPSLSLEVDRATELFQITKHNAILNGPLARVLTDSPFSRTYANMPPLEYVKERLSEILVKVGSNDVKQFAVGEENMNVLRSYRMRCQEIIYLQNIRKLFHEQGSYDLIANNLNALHELYVENLPHFEGDVIFHSYILALDKRYSGLKEAVEVISDMTSGSMFDMGSVLSRLEAVRNRLGSVLEENNVGLDPSDAVPLKEGLDADIRCIRVLENSVILYQRCGGGRGYVDIVSSMEEFIRSAEVPHKSINWLDGFMKGLSDHIAAVHYGGKVPAVVDFSWSGSVVSHNVRSSFFGGSERSSLERSLMVPFWVARMEFSRQKGIIFKEGSADRGMLLVSAVGMKPSVARIEDESLMYHQCQRGMKAPATLGSSVLSLCPVVDRDTAYRKMKDYRDSVPDLRSGHLNMVGLVYFPAVVARFERKEERRAMLYADFGLSHPAPAVRRVRIGDVEVHTG